ncbi:MAG: hypothetical protein AUJ07_09105 [Crenarchaeota archaeon 13_1_40CM_3_53_5]|nr:MAG: hypothetical protein AUJ07_09105 [Crenarchaeota archaeon 13_1_40CM_3_53_5]
MVEEAIGLGVLFVLAFGNGANDVGKSITALMRDPETAVFQPSYKPLVWGGFFSGLGSASAILISGRLFSVFTPQSILRTSPGSPFILAALAGAAAWILLGTLLRVPVSTTHAIVGAVVLESVYLFGSSSLEWDFLIWRILLPLAAGPIAALIGVYLLSRLSRRRQGIETEGSSRVGIAHWGSAGAVAFGRGVNDAPKMAALGAFLLIATPEQSIWLPYIVVSVAVVAGSLVWGDRVAKTIIGRTAPLRHGQRLKADAATAVLVSAGAYFGDPFSTTQVSAATGGTDRKQSHVLRSAVRGMALPWVVTLPAAGLLAIAASLIAARFWG